MPECYDKAYYAARAVRFRELAETANDPAIAAIHDRLAASYAALADLTSSKPRTPKTGE